MPSKSDSLESVPLPDAEAESLDDAFDIDDEEEDDLIIHEANSEYQAQTSPKLTDTSCRIRGT